MLNLARAASNAQLYRFHIHYKLQYFPIDFYCSVTIVFCLMKQKPISGPFSV